MVEELECGRCEVMFTPGKMRFDESSGYANEEEVEVCEDCAQAQWEAYEEGKVY